MWTFREDNWSRVHTSGEDALLVGVWKRVFQNLMNYKGGERTVWGGKKKIEATALDCRKGGGWGRGGTSSDRERGETRRCSATGKAISLLEGGDELVFDRGGGGGKIHINFDIPKRNVEVSVILKSEVEYLSKSGKGGGKGNPQTGLSCRACRRDSCRKLRETGGKEYDLVPERREEGGKKKGLSFL